MIVTDRLSLFLGEPINLGNDIYLYSPTVKDIAKIGENRYNAYLIFSTFDASGIKEYMKQLMSNEHDNEKLDLVYEILKKKDKESFRFIVQTPLVELIKESLSFFAKEDVNFDLDQLAFTISNKTFVDESNYIHISNIIKKINNLKEKEEENIKFKNDRVKEKYKRMKELEAKYNIHKQLDLKDICSILCVAEGNNLSVFNVGDLTIYQVYEQFERLGIKESYNISLALWSNTFSMDKNGKLQEWMVKTKL